MRITRRAVLAILVSPLVVALPGVAEAKGSRRGGHSSGGSKGCGSKGGAGFRKSKGKCADKNGK